MAYSGRVERWDIFRADLDFPVGSEQGGTRPVIVVSNDGINSAFTVVTIVPLTKKEGKARQVYEFEVIIPERFVGLGFDSIAMPQQIRTISKARLLERVGSLEDPDLRIELENRMLEHLGIAFEAEE